MVRQCEAKFYLILVFALLFILNCPFSAKADPRAEINALLKEHEALKQEGMQLDNKAIKFKSIENNLKKKTDDYHKEISSIKRDYRQFEMDIADYNRRIEDYNSYCQGTFYEDEYRKRMEWCKQNGPPLFAIKHQLKQAEEQIGNRINQSKLTGESITKETLDWVEQGKELERKYKEFDSKRRNWLLRVHNFALSSSYQQLILVAEGSADCAYIEGIGEFEPQLDGASERAVRCLQRLWDGAR